MNFVHFSSSDGAYISPDEPPESPTSSVSTNRLPSLTESNLTTNLHLGTPSS